VFQGVKAGENSLLWTGIPIVVYPGATVRTIRITNVRSNAAQAGVASGAVIPTQISMFVSVTASTAIPINNPTQVVAAVLQGLAFGLQKCDDSGGASTTYYHCSSAGTTSASSLHHDLTGLLKFTEGFEVAFKKRIEAQQLSYLLTGYAAPLGSVFATSETGYVNPATLAPGGIAYYGGGATVPLIGGATSGTRLIARFAAIPDGVSIFVTTKQVTNGTTVGTTAALISVTDATGTSGSVDMQVPGTGSLKLKGVDFETADACTDKGLQIIAQVPIAGGAGSATWEMTAVSGTVTESVAFGYELAWSARPDLGQPAVSTAFGTVTGNFAPISSDDKMSAYSAIPRFADVPISKNSLYIYECLTNLLFPFVTARASFDTGIVISNTSLDSTTGMPGGTTDWPMASRAQAGKCTIIFFGDKEDGTSLTKPVQTSGVIATGKQLVFTVFGGGAGIDAAPGFQGYIIAHCKFQMAHGFAFISDLGAQKLAMGYLALILGPETTAGPPRRGREALDN